MTRDFTEAMKQRLLTIIHEVSPDQWFDFVRGAGPDEDVFSDLLSEEPALNFNTDDVERDAYYQGLLNAQDTSAKTIEAIFDAVSDQDHGFAMRIDSMDSTAKMVLSALWRL